MNQEMKEGLPHMSNNIIPVACYVSKTVSAPEQRCRDSKQQTTDFISHAKRMGYRLRETFLSKEAGWSPDTGGTPMILSGPV